LFKAQINQFIGLWYSGMACYTGHKRQNGILVTGVLTMPERGQSLADVLFEQALAIVYHRRHNRGNTSG
jgi:hypothetical protein